MKKSSTVIGILLASGLLTGGATAESWTVDDDGPADFNTIQAAIDAAADGDRILVHPGRYTGAKPDFEPIANFRGKSLTLIGLEGHEATIIDGEDSRTPITLFGADNPDMPSKIDGFTIRNGTGGGITVAGDRVLKVGFCTIEQCREPGIWSYGRVTLTVSNCTIRENDSTYLSGGILTDEGDVLLVDTVFSGNYSDTLGGALRLWGAFEGTDRVDIIRCTFDANIASQGAAVSANDIVVHIQDCTFNANFGGQGTALYMLDGEAVIGDTLFCEHQPEDIQADWTDLGGNEFIADCGNACVADLDGNDIVDGGDLTMLLGFWGSCTGCPGDLTGDDLVDGADLTLLLGLWGDC